MPSFLKSIVRWIDKALNCYNMFDSKSYNENHVSFFCEIERNRFHYCNDLDIPATAVFVPT